MTSEEIKKTLKDSIIQMIHRKNDEAKHGIKEVINAKAEEIVRNYIQNKS